MALRKFMLQCNDPATKHILGYAQSLRGGGVERVLLRLSKGWVESGRRVTLVIGSAQGPLAAEIPAGVQVRELGSSTGTTLLARLAGEVRHAAPDLIFCPGNHYTGIAAATRLRLGSACPPLVAKVSNALVRPEMGLVYGWGYRRWLRQHPHFLDHIVAMSPAMAEEARTQMRMPNARVSVIANPPSTQGAGAAVPLPHGRFLIGVGRLEPQKRWDRLIGVLPRIDPSVSLLILGEGSQHGALVEQAMRLGVAHRVTMPGYAADPTPALAGAAVAVLTSDFEGVPGVLREALAVGTPVVATESSVAVREIIDSTTKGHVVARDDADALVAAIGHWLSPAAVPPLPVAQENDSVADYLALFDRLVAQRRR